MKRSAKIRALRESGQVQRFHTCPHIGDASVAAHCFNAVSMLYVLNPSPSHDLVRALLWHDSAERWVGDIPGSIKWRCPEVKRALDKCEEDYKQRVGISFGLTEDERLWLKEMDVLDLFLYALDQLNMGNRAIEPSLEECIDWFEKRGHSTGGTRELHRGVWEAYRNLGVWERLTHEDLPPVTAPNPYVEVQPKTMFHFLDCKCDFCRLH